MPKSIFDNIWKIFLNINNIKQEENPIIKNLNIYKQFILNIIWLVDNIIIKTIKLSLIKIPKK